MANRKLNSIKFPDIADTYILDADKVNFDDSETYASGSVGKALQNKANIDGSYEDLTAGTANQINTSVRANDKTPYLFRTSGGSVDIGDREYINGIVGGTVAWNQLSASSAVNRQIFGLTLSIANSKATLSGTPSETIEDAQFRVTVTGNAAIVGHKYYIATGSQNVLPIRLQGNLTAGNIINAVDGMVLDLVAKTSLTSGVAYSQEFYPQIFDLTQMFGSTIADYIYSLEQATAGAGVAWFKKLFNKPYYAYNAGELKSVSGLVSHDMTGFNQWDEEWEAGIYSTIDGAPNVNATRIRSKNPISVTPNTTYYFEAPTTYGNINVLYYDADDNYISYEGYKINTVFTTPANCAYIRWNNTTNTITTYNNDICINISWDGSRNGEYEPYVKHSYPLDSDLTLRGIPKLDADNKLYYDGDTYESDGTVTRKYGVVDLGSLNWSKATNTYKTYFVTSAEVSDMKKSTGNTVVQPIICNRYITNTWSDTLDLASTDKCICVGWSGKSYLAVADAEYNDSTGADFKTAMNGVYLVYELATPTTETADPYTSPQIVDDFGTEEYVVSGNTFAVPVGHDTDYPINMVAKLEMAPNSPDGNGDYIVRQTNGENVYVPLIIEDALPTIPSTAGTYKLTVTVAEGSDPVLAWTAE